MARTAFEHNNAGKVSILVAMEPHRLPMLMRLGDASSLATNRGFREGLKNEHRGICLMQRDAVLVWARLPLLFGGEEWHPHAFCVDGKKSSAPRNQESDLAGAEQSRGKGLVISAEDTRIHEERRIIYGHKGRHVREIEGQERKHGFE